MTGFSSESDNLVYYGTTLGRCRQYLASIIVTLGIFGLGTVLAWTSPAIPAIEASGDLGNVTHSEKAWIGSMSMLGALSASPFAGAAVERIGRKMTMIALAFPFIVGWAIIPMGKSLPLVYAGRFITGFAAGGFSLASPIFISEISENHIRGILSNFFQLMMVTGILFIYVVGSYVTWQSLAYISIAFPALFLVSIYFIPETPRYLLAKRKRNEATVSLMWYRGATDEDQVQVELLAMEKGVEDSKRETKTGLKSFSSRSVIQPVLICLSLMVFEQISGFNAIIFYTVDIFGASGSGMDANLSTIIVGTVQVAATVVSALLVDRAGRRVLLIFSEVVMAIALLVLGTYYYFEKVVNKGAPLQGWSWLPLTCLLVFIVAFAQGIGPLSWTMMGEILPPNLKGACSSIATLLVWFSAFLVTVSYEHLLQMLGIYWCFWIYGIFCVVGAVVIAIYVPETKGRSLDEIQQLFIKKGDRAQSYS